MERRKNTEDVIDDIKQNYAEHRLEMASRLGNVENSINNATSRISNLEGALLGVDIKDMAKSVKNIEHRLFKTNGTRALITEVQDIHKELNDHLSVHKNTNLTKAKIGLMIFGVMITSSFGTFLSYFVLKLLSS
jgi:hypothetical protein